MHFGNLNWLHSDSRISDGRIVLNYNELKSLPEIRQEPGLKVSWLIWANYCNLYIEGLRKASNSASYVNQMARLEKSIYNGLFVKARSDPSDIFYSKDADQLEQIYDKDLIEDFNKYCYQKGPYLNVYDSDQFANSIESSDKTVFYLLTKNILSYPNIIEILCHPRLIGRCRQILGKSAKITWMWLWYTKPRQDLAPNQKWHRDSSEPFNFVRVFIPLTSIPEVEYGPTEIVPGSSQVIKFCEPRRYSDEELRSLLRERGTKHLTCDSGDVYLANTFALHRGTPIDPDRPVRGMFSLLVSLHPSNRTPGMPKIRLSDIPSKSQELAVKNNGWLRHVVNFCC